MGTAGSPYGSGRGTKTAPYAELELVRPAPDTGSIRAACMPLRVRWEGVSKRAWRVVGAGRGKVLVEPAERNGTRAPSRETVPYVGFTER